MINKIKERRFAKSQAFLLDQEGSLLNAFYKSKTIFIHIPKTAGTSLVKAVFGNVKGGGHRKCSFYKYILAENFDEYFKFCFVRNPYNRLFSSYKFLEKGGMNIHDKRALEIYLRKYKDFEDFVLNGLNKKIMFEIMHFIPQTEFICDKNGKLLVDFVGRFENLEKDIEILSGLLQKKIDLPHLNKNKNKQIQGVYTMKMKEKVKKLYAKDFEILDYSKEC
ncbi:MAG: sulfotransferase family 2 domain-containing protein [Flavobacteriales bacterium]|nr:sulfotransferase family 2 domain-containing protein [Flavobacteriales bacterium]